MVQKLNIVKKLTTSTNSGSDGDVMIAIYDVIFAFPVYTKLGAFWRMDFRRVPHMITFHTYYF